MPSRRESVRKQCSEIFLLTRNISTNLPGNHKAQLRESLKNLKSVTLDETEKKVLESCRQELFKTGESALGDLVQETCRGSASSPKLI